MATRRDDPANLDVTTKKSFAEFQSCFADATARGDTPTFLPKANGGTYTMTVSGYVLWVVDVSDEGVDRRIVVHEISSMWGKGKHASKLVQTCL